MPSEMKKSAPELPPVSNMIPMGAIPHDKGTLFRVWAPNAEKVFVCGSFNEWSPDNNPMNAEADGFWAVDVHGAKPGDHYKFRIVNGDFDVMRLDPYAREVTNSVGDGVIVDPVFEWEADDYRTPAFHEMVIYEIHIGTFNPKDGRSGNFDSAIEKLPYLKELGVNVVQLMPPTEFAGGISWGYNPALPFAVESEYGGVQAFKRFVKAAHQIGLAVVLDVVYNHFGPSDLSLWQFDGWNENGMGGIYFYNDWKANTPWGDTRPNYNIGQVRQFIRDNALMWLQDYHLDGLRWDATAYIRNVKGNDNPGDDLPEGWSLMQWINDEIDKSQPWKIAIAEDLRGSAAVVSPTADGGAGFNAQWDAGFVHPVREALIAMDDTARNIGAVANAVTNLYGVDPFTSVIYTESHDEVANGKSRVPEEIAPGNAGSYHAKKRATLGAVLVFTTPGIPMLFMGQEFLEDQWFQDTRPLDWSKTEKYAGILQLHRDLMILRRNGYDTTKGLQGRNVTPYHVNIHDNVLAYHRWWDGGPRDSVVVIANFSAQPKEGYVIGMPAAGLWKARFNSDWTGYDGEYNDIGQAEILAEAGDYDGQPAHAKLNIGPYSAIILSQD
jgi:1,4-alpha-glucan branching enzyme